MRSSRGGGGSGLPWPSSPDSTPTCAGGSRRIQTPPAAGSGTSPPGRRRGSRVFVDQGVAGHLGARHGVFFCLRMLPSGNYTTYGELSDPPLRLKYSAEYLPEKATSGGILPSSSMIWATWSEKTKTRRQESRKRRLKTGRQQLTTQDAPHLPPVRWTRWLWAGTESLQ